MVFFGPSILLLAAGSATVIHAHTSFTNFFINGVNQGDGVAVRMSNVLSQATFPIDSVASPNMACGVNGEQGVSRVASASAGDMITFEWRDHPDASAPGSIDPSHKGPCAVYMKSVTDATANDNAQGPGWFKIMEDGYDNTTKTWCTEKIIPMNGHMAASIPKDIAPGYYLLRPELLALHQADKNPPDPQFYVGCAQIFVKSNGNGKPKETVSIPGYVNMQTPAMTYHVWDVPLKLPFPDFGPPLYTSSSGKRDLQQRGSDTQTIGLKPAGCVMQNGNWCGFMPPKYTDQTSCYSSSSNCSSQTQACYNSAGPTGGKNCHNWENYCTQIRTDCGSGSGGLSGPPSIQPLLPASPANLGDQGKVVYATAAMPGASQATGAPVAQSAPASKAAAYVPAASQTAVPAVQPVTAGSAPAASSGSSSTGSIDTCGTDNGGLKCAAGLCCSSHGYCGNTPEYCSAGCQASFGQCQPTPSSVAKSHKKRRHIKRSHVMRRHHY